MTHISLFTEAQTTVGKLFAEQRESQNEEETEAAETRNQRIAQEALRVARNLISPSSHGFTVVAGEDSDSFYQAVADILGPDVTIYRVIESRDGGLRTRNHYACQCEFGQIERHFREHLRSYYAEHQKTFIAKPPAAPS